MWRAVNRLFVCLFLFLYDSNMLSWAKKKTKRLLLNKINKVLDLYMITNCFVYVSSIREAMCACVCYRYMRHQLHTAFAVAHTTWTWHLELMVSSFTAYSLRRSRASYYLACTRANSNCSHQRKKRINHILALHQNGSSCTIWKQWWHWCLQQINKFILFGGYWRCWNILQVTKWNILVMLLCVYTYMYIRVYMRHTCNAAYTSYYVVFMAYLVFIMIKIVANPDIFQCVFIHLIA